MRALVTCIAFLWTMAAPALADETVSGSWTIDVSRNGTPRLSLHSSDAQGKHEHSDDVHLSPNVLPAGALEASQPQHVRFAMVREAGKYAFDGQLGSGRGSGTYALTLNDRFFDDIRSRGYDTSSTDVRAAFASLDVTREYVDEMDSLGLQTTTPLMISMRALGVDGAYVRSLRDGNITGLTVANIIAMRALHVDSSYIRYLRTHGIKNLTAANVIAMKAENI